MIPATTPATTPVVVAPAPKQSPSKSKPSLRTAVPVLATKPPVVSPVSVPVQTPVQPPTFAPSYTLSVGTGIGTGTGSVGTGTSSGGTDSEGGVPADGSEELQSNAAADGEKKKGMDTGTIAGIGAGCAVLVILFLGLFFYANSKKKSAYNKWTDWQQQSAKAGMAPRESFDHHQIYSRNSHNGQRNIEMLAPSFTPYVNPRNSVSRGSIGPRASMQQYRESAARGSIAKF